MAVDTLLQLVYSATLVWNDIQQVCSREKWPVWSLHAQAYLNYKITVVEPHCWGVCSLWGTVFTPKKLQFINDGVHFLKRGPYT